MLLRLEMGSRGAENTGKCGRGRGRIPRVEGMSQGRLADVLCVMVSLRGPAAEGLPRLN